MPLILLEHIYKQYETERVQVEALHDVSLAVRRGEFLAIVGRSGSGKSTLMNIIGCLDTPTDGRYILDERDVSRLSDKALSQVRAQCIGFVFQKFHLMPELTALENVELPLVYRGLSSAKRRRLAADSLKRVGLEERMHHRPSELSGGQQQRVAIARAIAAQPPLILADEPTGNLDSASGETVMRLLKELHAEGHTVVLITHDRAVASAAERVIRLRDGRLTEEQEKEQHI